MGATLTWRQTGKRRMLTSPAGTGESPQSRTSHRVRQLHNPAANRRRPGLDVDGDDALPRRVAAGTPRGRGRRQQAVRRLDVGQGARAPGHLQARLELGLGPLEDDAQGTARVAPPHRAGLAAQVDRQNAVSGLVQAAGKGSVVKTCSRADRTFDSCEFRTEG